MIRNKASNKFRTFFTCLFISLFVVGFISIPLQADDYTTQGFEITVFNPKNGKSFTENLKFILHNGNYYTTNGNIASCGMFDLASPEDNCKSYKRDVFSLYDNKKLKDVTYSYNNDDYFEYDGNYWFNFNKSMELLKTKVLFDGERIMVFPLKYTPEEIRIMLIDIFDRSEFKIEENSIDSAFADTWKLMKSGNYSGLLSGSEMVDEYTSLLVEIGQPNNKELEISNNLSKYYSASGSVGAVEKVLNGWTALDNLYVVKWTTEESETGPNGETVTKKKNHVTTRLYTPGYDINSLALSPKQAAISILNANEKEWGTWFDNLIDKEKDIVSIYKSYNSLKEIKNENPSYVKAMRYGIMVNPGTGDLLHGKAYTKDNRYMYDAANTLQTKMSDVYNFVGYSIADEFLKYGTSTINKQITEQLFSGYRKILVDAFFAAADQYGISEHMDKVQYAAMCRYIMEKCADNFNKAPGDLESMKYCTLMYLKTFLIYKNKYAKYTNYIANEEQILSAIMEISSLNDDDLYGFSIEHVFDANCNYKALQGYNSKNSLMPVTYGYEIVIKGASVGNLIIPNEYNGLPVLKVTVSGGSENIRKIVVPSTVHYVDVSNLPNLEELLLPENVNSVSLDDYVIIRNFNTLSLDISSLPSLKKIKLNDSVTNLSVYNVGIEEICIPKSVESYSVWQCKDLKKVSFSDGIETTKGAVSECDSLIDIQFPQSLKTICNNAFHHCNALTNVVIPNGVVSIGKNAFEYDKALTSVSFSENLTSIDDNAFFNCISLKSIHIPNKVTTIGKNAFMLCSEASSINLPEELISIGYGAFASCGSFTEIRIPNKVTSIGDKAFSGCESIKEIVIPDSVTFIGESVFDKCTSLESAVLPKDLISIPYGIFYGCTKLKTVVIPEKVSSVCDFAFYLCSDLYVIIPNSVVSVGRCAFVNTDVESIPNSVTTIGDEAFRGCPNIKSLPENVTSIGSGAFKYCLGFESIVIPKGINSIEKDTFYGCTELVSVIVPEGVTKIEDYAFYNCLKLNSIDLPTSLTSIGTSAFRYTALKAVVIPGSLASVKSFNDCTELSTVNISEGVSTICEYGFARCGKLTTISLTASVKSIEDNAFTGCESIADVYFYGTEEDWNSISVGLNNDNLLKASIHFVKVCMHSLNHVDAKKPMCTVDGFKEYYECSKCHKKFSDADGTKEISAPIVIKAFGHSWDEGTETKPATCEESGEKTYHCTREGCNETKKETIDALGHKLKEVPEKAPTKTETGNIAHFECEMCHKLFRDADGKEAISVEQTIIPVMTHNLTFVKAKTATCTEAGNKEYYKCDDPDCNCGKLYSDKYGRREIKIENTIIPANGPNLSYQKAPTCTEDGIELYYKCSECGKLFSDREGKHEIEHYKTIPKLGHDFEKVESVKETYHKDGNIEYYLCKRCGKKYEDIEGKTELNDADIIIPKKGAAALGETAQAGDLQYKITNPSTDGSGTVTLIGVENGSSTVVIPASVEIKECNYKVTVIGANAFNGNETIKTLFIGVNIVAIDTKAFYGCTNLTKVSGGAGLKSIGSYAFAKCPKLSYFKLTSKVLTKIGAYDFSGDKKLKTLYIKYTTKLTKSGVKKSLKGSKIKTVKVKKSKVKKYKKYFTKKNCGRKVKVKK